MKLKTFVWTETDSMGYGDATIGEFKETYQTMRRDALRMIFCYLCGTVNTSHLE